ncbi:Charged multivesicular body protein 3 [Gaertneriomyces sp. JEL0708]|nr:Snf7-domain-containing protein [Gaertneriomyces semiglobifer]KAJ3190230.1 Charged multivesicular body protein 3 [Gaertneriomyces sp. JEL0708]
MASVMQIFLGKRLTPEEQIKKWRQTVRVQEREIDKNMRAIDAEEMKAKRVLKQAAKRNDTASCKILAKEIVRSRKAKDRMYTSKAQLGSLVMCMQHQLATMKIAGTLQKSTDVMKIVNNLVKLPEISATMQEMGAEMMKAGIIEEMMTDAIEMGDEEGIEEEAEDEVNKVLFELTDGLLGEAPGVGADLQHQKEQPEAQEENLDDMASRLAALRA